MENYEACILGHNEGFHITFENGLTVSVQWGRGTYTQNGHMNFESVKPYQIPGSPDVEIALLNSYKHFVDPRDYGIDVPDEWDDWFNRDDVVGYVPMEELVEFLYKVSKAKGGRCFQSNEPFDVDEESEAEE